MIIVDAYGRERGAGYDLLDQESVDVGRYYYNSQTAAVVLCRHLHTPSDPTALNGITSFVLDGPLPDYY